MGDISGEAERRIIGLGDEISVLRARVEDLSARLATLESGGCASLPKPADAPQPARTPAPSEGVLERAGRGAVLPRIAVVCFVLVFALILRTITDSGVVDARLGSILGIGYVIALILAGWRLYAVGSKLAPVFPASGLLLLFSIILEAHGRFQTLSTTFAYILLFIAGGVVTGLGLRYRASFTLCAAGLGTGIVGLAIGFPYPVFPLPAVIILAANFGAAVAARRSLCPSLRWSSLGLVFLFWLYWSFKLSVPATCDEPTAKILYLSWFFPMLALYLAFFISAGVRMVLAGSAVGIFEGMAPTITSVGAFFAAWHVTSIWFNSRIHLLGFAVFAVGLVSLAIAAWLASRRAKEGAPGCNCYTFSGIFLIAASLVLIVGNLAYVLPLWAVTGLVLVFLADRWHNGGVRVTSYVMQVITCATAVISKVYIVDVASLPAAIGSSLVLSLVALVHYHWARGHKPPTTQSAFFSWLDRGDISAVSLLVAGLVSGFLFSRLVLLALMPGAPAVFAGSQSVLINGAAIALMLLAVRKKSAEILLVGVGVALIGGFKVFLIDMFQIKGMPLVAGVFTFGVVAAVGSVVSGRWQSIHGKGSRSSTPP